MSFTGQCRITSAALDGIDAVCVDVEVLVSAGMPSFLIVGLADTAVQESRERIRSAIKAQGYTMPMCRIVVNLAPSSLKKSGTAFDVAISLGILVATRQVDPRCAHNRLFVGELSLDGRVRCAQSILPCALTALRLKYALVCGPLNDQLGELQNLSIGCLETLRDIEHLETHCVNKLTAPCSTAKPATLDFADIVGNTRAKRALQIAAAGRHGLLMIGPPGSGKSMLASRLPSILPELSADEKIQTAVIHSIRGLSCSSIFAGYRPFRNPHHSITQAGLLGGGTPIVPGEISLAHNGVLFLDELAEFKSSVLQSLRTPLENGEVRIARAGRVLTFPARFSLIAALNPCPCGYYGDSHYSCKCSQTQIVNYQNKIGGPLFDRFDMRIEVLRIASTEIMETAPTQSSHDLRAAVLRARAFAQKRKPLVRRCISACLHQCNLSDNNTQFFTEMAEKAQLSGRGMVSILSVARTIADLEEQAQVSKQHILEAFSYRTRTDNTPAR